MLTARGRVVLKVVSLAVALSGLLGGAFAGQAGAVGAEVYRTDSYGRKTSTVFKVGNTGSSAYCAGGGSGAIRLGAKICYA